MIWCPTDEEANKYRDFRSMKNTKINAVACRLTFIVIKLSGTNVETLLMILAGDLSL